MVEPLLRVEHLCVDYAETAAVRDVSFEVEAGAVFGLIGENGAGKTSLLSAAASLVEPTSGAIHVCGHALDERPGDALRHLGFMPDRPPLYDDLSVREFLELFASAYGLARASRVARIDGVLERTGLSGARDALAGTLSRGLRQRLCLAKTLLHEPEVLLLDEPASGLDPAARTELAVLLRDLADAGRAVVVSSHILSELESACTHVALMQEGTFRIAGRIADVLDALRPLRSVRLVLARRDPRLGALLRDQANVQDLDVDPGGARFRLDGDVDQAAWLLRRLIEDGFEVAHFSAERGDLHDVFAAVHLGEAG